MLRFHAQTSGDIPQGEEFDRLLEIAEKVLASLDENASCHDAVGVWAKTTNRGKAVRGHFYPNFEHSWIDMGDFVLDLYPVAGCRPHFVAKTVARWLYLPVGGEYTKRLDDLREHSQMLGQIGLEMEEWCVSEECTTLDAVRLLKAEVMERRGKMLRQEIERRYGVK